MLAGLSPDIVSEICCRALSFWQYQTLQEFKFQQLERKEIEEKKRQVERKLNQLHSEAKSEIASINEKYNGFEWLMQALKAEHEYEKTRYQELQEQLNQKCRDFTKLHVQMFY